MDPARIRSPSLGHLGCSLRSAVHGGFHHLATRLSSPGIDRGDLWTHYKDSAGIDRGVRRTGMAACLRLVGKPHFLRWFGRMGAPDVCHCYDTFVGRQPETQTHPHITMKLSRKQMLLGVMCGLVATVALVWPALPMAEGPPRLANIPIEGPDFHSVPMELSPADTKFLAGAAAVQRIVRPHHGPPFMLTVIDGSGNRHAVHDPTYCLAGGGWNILHKQQIAMNSGEATWLSMEKDGVKLEALWFFDDGSEQFTSPLTYWSRASLRRATRGLSGPEPLLVMLRIPPGESADWKRIPQVLLPALGFR